MVQQLINNRFCLLQLHLALPLWLTTKGKFIKWFAFIQPESVGLSNGVFAWSV